MHKTLTEYLIKLIKDLEDKDSGYSLLCNEKAKSISWLEMNDEDDVISLEELPAILDRWIDERTLNNHLFVYHCRDNYLICIEDPKDKDIWDGYIENDHPEHIEDCDIRVYVGWD